MIGLGFDKNTIETELPLRDLLAFENNSSWRHNTAFLSHVCYSHIAVRLNFSLIALLHICHLCKCNATKVPSQKLRKLAIYSRFVKQFTFHADSKSSFPIKTDCLCKHYPLCPDCLVNMGEDKNAASEQPWRNGGQQNGRISRLLAIRDFQKYSLPKAGVNSLKNQFCSFCSFHLFHSLFHSHLISGTETVPGVIVSCPHFTSSILAKIVLHILLLC